MLTVDPFYDIRALTANARLLFGKVLANDMRKRLLLDRVTLMLKLEKAYRERRSKRKKDNVRLSNTAKLVGVRSFGHGPPRRRRGAVR